MRKPEQRLWDRISDNCCAPGLWLQRVENGVIEGMPDVLSIFRGRVVWIELKFAVRPARETTRLLGEKGLRVSQRNWHLDWQASGGTSFVLIADHKREMYLIDGALGDRVNEMTVEELRAARLASDWTGITQQLKGTK